MGRGREEKRKKEIFNFYFLRKKEMNIEGLTKKEERK